MTLGTSGVGASGAGGAGALGGSRATAGAASGMAGNRGTCTASKAAGTKVSGSGPDQVTVETNADSAIDVAWLNWRLKGDETATGKGVLVGSGCQYCTDSAWEVKSANLE